MISLERLVELRSDQALVKRLDDCTHRARQLIGLNSDEILSGVLKGDRTAVQDAHRLHEAVSLAVYEEARRPLVEFLRELDRSAIVRVRPHLHRRLKELIK